MEGINSSWWVESYTNSCLSFELFIQRKHEIFYEEKMKANCSKTTTESLSKNKNF